MPFVGEGEEKGKTPST